MKELFTLIKERLLNNENLVLVTVIESSGSTPRGAEARMLVGESGDGRLWGSIGGGLPEHHAIEEAAALTNSFQQHDPVFGLKKYKYNPSEAAELGAICGGEISILFRSLNADEPGLLELIEKGLTCFADKKAAWFILEVLGPALCIAGVEGVLASTANFPQVNLQALLKSAPVCIETEGKKMFSQPMITGSFVYIFGGGHIARELLPLLAHLDFRCIVFDDREEFARADLFPQAEKVIHGDFNNIGAYLNLTDKDYAVIVTRGHLWDFEAWAFALASQAVYIGIIGSKTKHELVKAKLRERGFDNAVLSAPRVHAPIGLDIKSETPAEIALSIAAELVLTRAGLTEENPN
ncbi:MAG: XdhC family protein [Treponema sp.]|nr:XdhC family protein [Treponema sp.]